MTRRCNSREDKTIDQFCTRLSVIEKQPIKVIERPDRKYPGKGGCDAIIERGGKQFALEHTTIDSFEEQRADSFRFKQVVVPLEKTIAAAYQDSWIEIVVPTHVITTGIDWGQLSKRLEDGCIKAIANIPFGEKAQHIRIEGVSFDVRIVRREARKSPGCYVIREKPADQKEQLVNNIAKAIREKRSQLQPYCRKGLPTILLLDSDDFALVSHHSLAEAFGKAAQKESTRGLDEVYIAEADVDPIWFFPVKLQKRIYPRLPEFRQFFEWQYDLIYDERRKTSRA